MGAQSYPSQSIRIVDVAAIAMTATIGLARVAVGTRGSSIRITAELHRGARFREATDEAERERAEEAERACDQKRTCSPPGAIRALSLRLPRRASTMNRAAAAIATAPATTPSPISVFW